MGYPLFFVNCLYIKVLHGYDITSYSYTQRSVWREWSSFWNNKVALGHISFRIPGIFASYNTSKWIAKRIPWNKDPAPDVKRRMLCFYCVFLRPLNQSAGKTSMQKQSCPYQPSSRYVTHETQEQTFFYPPSAQLLLLLTSMNTHLKCLIVFPGPKMVAVRNYHGTPAAAGKTPLCFQTGDFIELLKGDPDTTWWEVVDHIYLKPCLTLIHESVKTLLLTLRPSKLRLYLIGFETHQGLLN